MKRSDGFPGLTGRSLKLLLCRLCEAAHRDVSRFPQHEAVAVHQLRLRMKKIHALLRMAEHAVKEQTLHAMRQHIRSVKNACAVSRGNAVRDELIDKLAHRFHLPITRLPHPVTKACDHPSTAFIRHQLLALEQLVKMADIEHLGEEEILVLHTRCYRRGRRLLKQIAETADEPSLHRWRHRVKDLYFQTLVLHHLPGARKRIRRSHRLGSLLGRDHDLAELAQEPAFRSRRGPWPELIRERREQLRKRFLALAFKLYSPACSRFNQRVLPH
ncbi:MAG: CHAD domain-containing protein [Prosthecobacter sp.]